MCCIPGPEKNAASALIGPNPMYGGESSSPIIGSNPTGGWLYCTPGPRLARRVDPRLQGRAGLTACLPAWPVSRSCRIGPFRSLTTYRGGKNRRDVSFHSPICSANPPPPLSATSVDCMLLFGPTSERSIIVYTDIHPYRFKHVTKPKNGQGKKWGKEAIHFQI